MASVAPLAAHPPPPPPSLTLEAWADMDEDEAGELVDGRLEEEEVTTILHEAAVSWLHHAFRSWAAPRGGWVFGSELKVAISRTRGRKPDVSMYLPGAPMPSARAGVAMAPPSLVVEVLSPQPRDVRRDRVDKIIDYARAGVRFYWVVDPEVRDLQIYELGADGRYVVALAAFEGTIAVPGCEELTLDLDALFRELDRLLAAAPEP